jgi:predicted N-acetyltransferase YhbS
MIIIREEKPEEIKEIRNVNEPAFGQENEAIIIEKLRKRGGLTISIVAVQGAEVVGHIAFSPVVIEAEGSALKQSPLPQWQFSQPVSVKESARKWSGLVSRNADVLDTRF